MAITALTVARRKKVGLDLDRDRGEQLRAGRHLPAVRQVVSHADSTVHAVFSGVIERRRHRGRCRQLEKRLSSS